MRRHRIDREGGEGELQRIRSSAACLSAAVLYALTSTPAASAAPQARAEFYVSPGGDDANPGTQSRPFASFERAREAVRQAKRTVGLPSGAVVWVRGGEYPRSRAFALGPEDSGQAGAPVIYSAYANEVPRLLGGKVIAPSWWRRVEATDARWPRLPSAARGKVFEVELAAHGMSGFGALAVRGGGYRGDPSAPTAAELFFKGTSATLARWPNAGEEGPQIRGGMALTSGASDKGHLQVGAQVPPRWATALARGEVWLHAWAISYSDLHVHVTSVQGDTLSIDRADGSGLGFFYEPPAGAPYYAENVLEELDSPGEWWMDRARGELYFWPPSPLSSGEAVVSTAAEPLVQVRDASHLSFVGMTFRVSRSQLARVENGSFVTFERCRFENAGSAAVAIVGGSHNGVNQSLISGAGDQGVWLEGGVRRSLEPAENFVRRSEIHHIGRWSWTHRPAIELHGVGNIVADNRIHDLPDQAIWIHGNNHIIERNEIWNTARYSSDSGAIYAGRSWTERGNEVRYNYIHDVHGWFDAEEHGVYLDDGHCGTRVIGNVFRNVGSICIFVGGGRDNNVENNILEACGRAAFHVDNRTAGWGWRPELYPGDMLELDYRSAPWARAYPALAAIPPPPSPEVTQTSHWAQPEGNVFSRNLGRRNRRWIEGEDLITSYFSDFADNMPDGDPRWVREAEPRRGVRRGSALQSIRGWRAIPFDRIGAERGGAR